MPYFGRRSHYVDCRPEAGGGLAYGIAKPGTISMTRGEDALIVSMIDDEKHIPRPVCEIARELRRQGIKTGVQVLGHGGGTPPVGEIPHAAKGRYFILGDRETDQMNGSKVLIFHMGNVKFHVLHKTKVLLQKIRTKSIVICQYLLDYEDFAKVGVKTRLVRPVEQSTETLGELVGLVTGVMIGQTCPQEKIEQLIGQIYTVQGAPFVGNGSLTIGSTVRYLNTGTTGIVKEIVEIEGRRWALLDKTNLLYDFSSLEEKTG